MNLRKIINDIIKGNGMSKSPVKTPVKYSSSTTLIQHEAAQNVEFLDDCSFGECEGVEPSTGPSQTQEDKDRLIDENLARVKFADQIKIDFIQSIDYRILCRFLGVTTVNDIKNHPYQSHPLITLILMESLNGFMEHEGYECVGELNFDSHGNSIPPEKNPWDVKGKETTFTTTGSKVVGIFFEKIEKSLFFYLTLR